MNWFARVETYLDEIEPLVAGLDQMLQTMRVETSEMNPEAVQHGHAQLMEALSTLEQKIAQREELLCSEEAPQRGATLTEKLLQSGSASSRLLSDRCRSTSAKIASVNQRAVALFVCQFHLSQLSGEIIRLLAGQTAPTTYQSPSRQQSRENLGGGLFNEAA